MGHSETNNMIIRDLLSQAVFLQKIQKNYGFQNSQNSAFRQYDLGRGEEEQMGVVFCVHPLLQLEDPLEHLLVAGVRLPLAVPQTFLHSDFIRHLRRSCIELLSSRNPTLFNILQGLWLKKIPEKKTNEESIKGSIGKTQQQVSTVRGVPSPTKNYFKNLMYLEVFGPIFLNCLRVHPYQQTFFVKTSGLGGQLPP